MSGGIGGGKRTGKTEEETETGARETAWINRDTSSKLVVPLVSRPPPGEIHPFAAPFRSYTPATYPAHPRSRTPTL